MPRVRTLTLARGFKFQTASHEFSLTFFRALHCSQTEHAHKRLSIPHVDTVTETGRQKFTSIASASGSESQSCAATILTKKKACLATSLSKLITILSRNPCFARIIVALDSLLWPQRWLPFCSSLFLKLLTYLHCDMHAVYLIRCFAIVCSEGS